MARETKNLLVNHLHDQAVKRYARQYLRGKLIDIGCGTKPFQHDLCGLVSEHIGVDLGNGVHGSAKLDLVGSAYAVPADSESFDSALCTAVLEHLEDSEAALRECFRLLKPGSHAVYTVPFIWHLHEEPRDFYRFTRYGLEHLFKETGFVVEKVEPLSGFWVTFGQMFVYYLYRFNRGPLKWFPLIPAIGLVVQAFSYLLNKFDQSPQWTWMYIVSVRKP